MMNFKRFFSPEAIIIYLLIIIISVVLIITIGADDKKILYFSIVINVISVLGFLITVNQIVSWKENSDNNERLLNDKLKEYFKTALFQDFIMKTHILEATEKSAVEGNWTTCLTNLRSILRLIDELEVLNERYDLEIDPDIIIKFRQEINVCSSSIENNMRFSPEKITSNSITKKVRPISSVVHSKITHLKATLS